MIYTIKKYFNERNYYIMDVFKATDGQIWTIGEDQDKFNRKEEDNVLCGKRPGLVLRSSGTNCLIIPFSTSVRYSSLCRPINIGNGVESYPAIDCVQTISSHDLTEYRSTLKPVSYDKTLKVFIDYCMGKIQYSSSVERYVYINNQSGHENNGGTDITKRHYNKKSVDDKLFILTHTAEEIHDEFGMSLSYAKIMRSRLRNELTVNKDLNSYNSNEIRAIRNKSVEELQSIYGLDELSIKYLKHMFIRNNNDK